MDMYKEEQRHLLHRFLNNTFFNVWRNWGKHEVLKEGINASRIELQITPSCDLKCKYCYYSRFSNKGPHGESGLYPIKGFNKDKVIKNLDLLLSWLENNKFFPSLDLFSGEIFLSEVGFIVLERIVDWFIKNDVKHRSISIPTNMNFCSDTTKSYRVLNIINKAIEHNLKISISASIDGKYCEANRPFHDGTHNRDYDSIFKFVKSVGSGFHPMIYYDNIEHWKDNWLWFQEMFKKYNMPWESIYLLEVRNDGWTIQSVKHFQDFISFLFKWLIEKTNLKGRALADKIVRNNLNIFSCYGSIGRGIGCSIQSDLQIRLSDLTCNPCHRLSYPQFNSFKFINMYDRLVDIEPLNSELMYSIFTTNFRNFPYCQDCGIKYLCSGGCLGSQYESMGDIFTPIPSVCLMEHGKIAAIIEATKEADILHHVCRFVTKNVRDNILVYNNYLNTKGEV